MFLKHFLSPQGLCGAGWHHVNISKYYFNIAFVAVHGSVQILLISCACLLFQHHLEKSGFIISQCKHLPELKQMWKYGG